MLNMINSLEFIKRLERIMAHHQLTAAAFSDAIGVQRSSISHLLSGRNKPSLEFVLKVIKTYPEVNLYWLLNGIGTFPQISPPQKKVAPLSNPTPTTNQSIKPNKVDIPEPRISNINHMEIEHIIICYKNGHFKSYKP